MAAPSGGRQYWDPGAKQVWWMPQPPAGVTPTVCHELSKSRLAGAPLTWDGIWELPQSVQKADSYAFLVSWEQDLRHRGRCTRFGGDAAPRATPRAEVTVEDVEMELEEEEEDEEEEEVAKASAAASAAAAAAAAAAQPLATPAAAAAAAKAARLAAEAAAAAASAARRAARSAEAFKKKAARRLGGAEMALLAEEYAYFAAEAEGVRLTLLVAPDVVVQAVEASLVGGSPRKVAFRKAEAAGENKEIAVWVGQVNDFKLSGDSEVHLKVLRMDWRMDPYALTVLRNPDRVNGDRTPVDLRVDGAPSNLVAPPGPPIWSASASLPRGAAPAFARCPDHKLVLYELHVGSFTKEGTFDAAAAKLQHVLDLGCTALSLMPVHQDLRRLETGEADWWGYDVMSFYAVDTVYGTPASLLALVHRAHELGLAVLVDYVVNHMVWGSEAFIGPQYFLTEQSTDWGPRPDFGRSEVLEYALGAADHCLTGFGFDGIRVDSTKSIRKLPDDSPDADGGAFLAELAALCRRRGKLCVAEDLEDGDGILQFGGLGFHLQWDMALFCWLYEALVNPMDEYRDFEKVAKGLVGLCPGRGHALRGRVVFMESHDTAASDRYGRLPAAVHHGKAFMAGGGGEGGDAFQKAEGGPLPYPDVAVVEANAYAARRAAIGLVVMMACPGVPMLLQGQELCETSAFQWPRGPAMHWERLDGIAAARSPAESASRMLTQRWHAFTKELIAARLERKPLHGDGVHVFFRDGGVLAFLRWAELTEIDSRTASNAPAELALVVVNCTHNVFPSFLLGVPPARSWRLAVSSAMVTMVAGEAAGSLAAAGTSYAATPRTPNHDFPYSVDLSLPAYSASVFFSEP